MKVSLSELQLNVVDSVVAKGTHGRTRGEVLSAAFVEQAQHMLAGGGPYDLAPRPVLEVERPTYGPVRFDAVLPPVTGKALPVKRGEVLRLIQMIGGQCIDFNGYNLHDYKEYLDNGFNRMNGMPRGKGSILWSGSPRIRPMYTILDCSPYLDQYYSGHRCNALIWETAYGPAERPNCQDTFAETIREYGLTPDDVHDSFNLWMSVTHDAEGRLQFPWNRAPEGDAVDLLAFFDTLSVPVICGGETGVNNFEPNPVRVQVFGASEATLQIVDRVDERMGRFKSQLTPRDFRLQDIRVERELTRDPTYQASFIRSPARETVNVELSPEAQDMLRSVASRGVYGPSEEKVVVGAFSYWYQRNNENPRFTRLAIRER